MQIFAIIFAFFLLSLGQVSAKELDTNQLLEKVAEKYFEDRDDVVLLEFSKQEITFTYYNSDKEAPEQLSVDLGLDRIKTYIIREVKKKNPSEVLTPNPLRISDLMFASQFINNQIANMIPSHIRWRLYSRQMLMVYIDERFSGDLKEMICFPYSNSWDETKSLNHLTENLGKGDNALEKAGFSEPRYDLLRLLVGYNFFKLFGYYTTYVEKPSIKQQIDE